MPLLLTLAWRNVWRNRRRTLLTVAAIAFATLLTIVSNGLSIGTWEYNIRNMVELFSGYMQVQRAGYRDNPSLAKSVPYPGAVAAAIARNSAITVHAPRIQADGLAGFRRNSAGAAIMGIDPQAERRLSRLGDRVTAGRMLLSLEGDEAVAGYKLLENLNARVGDTIVLLAQGFDGVMGNRRFVVTGALRVGSQEFDAFTVLIGLRAAQELLAMEGRVSLVALGLRSLHEVQDAQRQLADALGTAEGGTLSVLGWEEVMPELKQSMEFDKVQNWFVLGILILIVTFGILNTVLMSVTERFREFGVSMAIGMTPGRLVALVFLETGMLALLGVLIGDVVGGAINEYFAANPIEFSGSFAEIYEQYGFQPRMMTLSGFAIPAEVTMVMMAICLLACLYPAYRVSKLEPLKGIRHT